MGNRAAVDRLDDVVAGANGSKVAAKLVPAGEAAAQRIEKAGEPCGTRPATPCLQGATPSNLGAPGRPKPAWRPSERLGPDWPLGEVGSPWSQTHATSVAEVKGARTRPGAVERQDVPLCDDAPRPPRARPRSVPSTDTAPPEPAPAPPSRLSPLARVTYRRECATILLSRHPLCSRPTRGKGVDLLEHLSREPPDECPHVGCPAGDRSRTAHQGVCCGGGAATTSRRPRPVPRPRDSQQRLRDALAEIVSGVVLDAAGALDAAATERRWLGLRRDPAA